MAIAAETNDSNVIGVFCPTKGWPPYLIDNGPSAPASGIMIDVFREIASSLAYDVKAVFLPEKRGMLLFRQGKVDAYPKAKTWMEHPEQFLWTDPIVDSVDVVISPASRPIQFTKPDDLLGMTLCVARGYVYPKLQAYFETQRIHRQEVNDTETILRMVYHGRVHGAVTNARVAQWIIRNAKHLRADDFFISTTPLDSAEYRFAFVASDQWKQFVPLFNAKLALMKQDGTLQALLSKYE